MLRHCARIILCFALAVLFGWLAKGAACTMPPLRASEWRVPESRHIGNPFEMKLLAYGGITSPDEQLFLFCPASGADCQHPLRWRPAGLCRQGFIWSATLLAWPLSTGVFSGEILRYLPQQTSISLPGIPIVPRNNLTPQWTELPEACHLADFALCTALLFCALPLLTALFFRRQTRLDERILHHLRILNHPAAPCVATLLRQKQYARYAGTHQKLDSLEQHCRRILGRGKL